MKNKSVIFRIICGMSAVCVLLLASSPIALLAFADSAPPVNLFNTQTDTQSATTVPVHTNPVNAIDAYYLNEDTNIAQTAGKPCYDVFTISERRNRGLLLEIPTVPSYYAPKVVYLTFDDGPDPENTPAALDILKSLGVKATFFVVGNQVEKHPDILKRIYHEGHAIGNHSYNHIYRELYKSSNTYLSQLQQTDESIKAAIGVRPRISRAPGGSVGSFTKDYWDALKSHGYTEVGWNVSSGDASSAKAEQILGNIVRQMDNSSLWSHAIILMHDGRGHTETIKALPDIIKFYKDRQYEFRVINFETPPPW